MSFTATSQTFQQHFFGTQQLALLWTTYGGIRLQNHEIRLNLAKFGILNQWLIACAQPSTKLQQR
eukprot:scaffold786_cov88-Cylindrotheca_fusiformis.AAC.1